MKPGTIIDSFTTSMGKEVVFRYPDQGDALQMCNYINALSQERTFIRYQGERIELDDEVKFLQNTLANILENREVYIMAFHNNTLIGSSQISLKDRTERHIGVFGISIAKEYRNEGIGKKLMQRVLLEAESNLPDLEIVTLGVFGDNILGYEIYQKAGFAEFGRLPNGSIHNGKKVDHIEMYKAIR
ncbi:MAG: GNAT family N-acetyltransferase [Patescibacteria group bacterium]